MCNITNRVKSIISQQLGIKKEDISSTSSLVKDFGADSLDIIELIMMLEEEFNIEIPDKESKCMSTIKTIVNYIYTQTNHKK